MILLLLGFLFWRRHNKSKVRSANITSLQGGAEYNTDIYQSASWLPKPERIRPSSKTSIGTTNESIGKSLPPIYQSQRGSNATATLESRQITSVGSSPPDYTFQPNKTRTASQLSGQGGQTTPWVGNRAVPGKPRQDFTPPPRPPRPDALPIPTIFAERTEEDADTDTMERPKSPDGTIVTRWSGMQRNFERKEPSYAAAGPLSTHTEHPLFGIAEMEADEPSQPTFNPIDWGTTPQESRYGFDSETSRAQEIRATSAPHEQLHELDYDPEYDRDVLTPPPLSLSSRKSPPPEPQSMDNQHDPYPADIHDDYHDAYPERKLDDHAERNTVGPHSMVHRDNTLDRLVGNKAPSVWTNATYETFDNDASSFYTYDTRGNPNTQKSQAARAYQPRPSLPENMAAKIRENMPDRSNSNPEGRIGEGRLPWCAEHGTFGQHDKNGKHEYGR